MKPRLLDLFAGAGGCSVGYDRAGFDVVGVDIEPHPDYPFELIVGDAVAVARGEAGIDLDDFDAVHASPPCPRFSRATPDATRHKHPDLLTPIQAALRRWGGTYVIENVPGAPLDHPVLLCGSAFGLRVRRHRLVRVQRLPHVPRLLPRRAPRCRGVRRPRRSAAALPPRRHRPRHQGHLRRRRAGRDGHRLDDPVGRPRRRHPAGHDRAHRISAPRADGEGSRMTYYSATRTSSVGTDFTYRPRPHSCATTYVTDARHSPSGQRIQPSCQPGTHLPSCSTSTARGSGKRRTASDTTPKVGQR